MADFAAVETVGNSHAQFAFGQGLLMIGIRLKTEQANHTI
ncbi:hypothetical protein NBRC111894_4633 [Sporolactobacillus inulinus]|uniref:Uncharacterized protein n=1 Tax=Sporolactobacillus inulinus TaxID=2078 RepID=A0A4Y1ZJ75_9BACL|nr:hypothetical protein NBRC111894_4633 [Sporolactobacillus inulinus]